MESNGQTRHLGLFDATSIGVGAIVGGGILALAGVALVATGPSAALAFGLNGLIALLTVLSFAELATAFPKSGGTYLYAKRVLTVGAAFYVGWVVWFASMVAAALYAIGFSTFLLNVIAVLSPVALPWIGSRAVIVFVSVFATILCTFLLTRKSGSGGNWVNIVKVMVFALLIAGGLYAWWRDQPVVLSRMSPFFASGPVGLLKAMGYSFIALQGFDLVAAVAGEVKDPQKTVPRAMLIALGIALLIYLPLLILIAIAGFPSGTVLADFVSIHPETIVARSARTFLGPLGFWLVMVAGLLSMISALMANLFAAARIAQVMARDRTLPAQLERNDVRFNTPVNAGWITAAIACFLMILAGDVGRAGAAASLIFLISFALVHGICILSRLRRADNEGFHVPLFPVLPILGGLGCAFLAVFQGVAVPAAGAITVVWLIIGFFIYIWIFERRARILDAATETSDPVLIELRGRSPLVLVPIANPDNAGAMAFLGACVAPPRVGRVLLLNVATLGHDPSGDEEQIRIATDVLRQSMSAAMRMGVRVECLATVAIEPLTEIERVARVHHCTSVLLGMSGLDNMKVRTRLEGLADHLPGHLIILRAPPGWQPRGLRRVLIPVGGRVVHNVLRARLIGGLMSRTSNPPSFSYLLILPVGTSENMLARHRKLWQQLVLEESSSNASITVVCGDNVSGEIIKATAGVDLVLLGLSHSKGRRRVFGPIVTEVVDQFGGGVMIIGQRD
ncbi:MAG: amino acid permease [bacterium]